VININYKNKCGPTVGKGHFIITLGYLNILKNVKKERGRTVRITSGWRLCI